MKRIFRRLVKRFGHKKLRTAFALIICTPIMAYGFYSGGWSSLAASIAGFFVGQLISNRIFD